MLGSDSISCRTRSVQTSSSLCPHRVRDNRHPRSSVNGTRSGSWSSSVSVSSGRRHRRQRTNQAVTKRRVAAAVAKETDARAKPTAKRTSRASWARKSARCSPPDPLPQRPPRRLPMLRLRIRAPRRPLPPHRHRSTTLPCHAPSLSGLSRSSQFQNRSSPTLNTPSPNSCSSNCKSGIRVPPPTRRRHGKRRTKLEIELGGTPRRGSTENERPRRGMRSSGQRRARGLSSAELRSG